MNIVFVGTPATPYGQRPCDVRLAAFANLMAEEHDVTILNRYSAKTNSNEMELHKDVQVVELIKKHKSLSALWLLLSLLKEPFKLIAMNCKMHVDVLHVYSGHYLDFVLYYLVSRLIGAKVVYQYVEYRSVKSLGNAYHRWNSKKCDFAGAKLWDGVINISDFLMEKSREVNPNAKQIKVTPLCDFSEFEKKETHKEDKPYLLFCGSIGYKEVVDLIADSYRQSEISKVAKLVMVLGGKKSDVMKYKEENTDIEILNGLDYDVLISYYKGAAGLFIPLRNSIEDTARFPNKICEYLAARGLVITTRFGEMPNYFKDGENALVAEDFSVAALKEKLDWLAENIDKVNEMKENAQKQLRGVFDQKANKERINEFLNEVTA